MPAALIDPLALAGTVPAPQAVLNPDHPLTRGLVLCYPFVERAGTPRNLAPIGGGATLSGTTKPTWLMGAVGPSLHGDGSSGYGDLGTGLSNTMTITRPMTVLALVRPSTVAAGRGAVSHSGLATTGGHKFGRSGAALLLTIHVQTTGATNVTTTATPLTTSAWWWIGAVVTTGNIHFVWAQAAPGGTGVLSTEDVANSTAGTAASNSFAHFLVDRSAGSALQEFFGGELAYYAWWAGRALSNAEINTLIRAPYDLLTLPTWYAVPLLGAAAPATSDASQGHSGAQGTAAATTARSSAPTGSAGAHGQCVTLSTRSTTASGTAGAHALASTTTSRVSTEVGQAGGHGQTAATAARTTTATASAGAEAQAAATHAGTTAAQGHTGAQGQVGLGAPATSDAAQGSAGAHGQCVTASQRTSAPQGHAGATGSLAAVGARYTITAGQAGALALAGGTTARGAASLGTAGAQGQSSDVLPRDITVTAGPLGTRWAAGALGTAWETGEMST